MARGDKTKKPTFMLWEEGKSLEEIQRAIAAIPGTSTRPKSVHDWITDWERGRQRGGTLNYKGLLGVVWVIYVVE